MRHRPGWRLVTAAGTLTCGVWWMSSTLAQPTNPAPPAPTGPADTAKVDSVDTTPPPAAPGASPPATEPAFLPGAALWTDPDLDTLLRQSRELRQGQHTRQTMALVQAILDHDGEALTSTDGRVYHPVRTLAQALLRDASAEELREYRWLVDGPAQALLDGATQESAAENPLVAGAWDRHPNPLPPSEATLAQVVRRYFYSSVGAQAAYLWACRRLDQGDALTAQRLLRRVLEEGRDPRPRGDEINLRLALAEALLGDSGAARAALAQAHSASAEGATSAPGSEAGGTAGTGGAGGAGPPAWAWNAVEQTLAQAALGISPTGMGGLSHPPADALPAARMARREPDVWLPMWTHVQEITAPAVRSLSPEERPNTPPRQHRGQLVGKWEECGWYPTTQVAIDGPRLLFRTHRALVCVDAGSGAEVWSVPDPGLPGGVNRYQYSTGFYQRDNAPVVPQTAEEILFFGDRRQRAVTLLDGVVYSLEGQTQASILGLPVPMMNQVASLPPNTLAAVAARDGRVLWRCDSTELERVADAAAPGPPARATPGEETARATACRFVGLPVADGAQLLVAVARGDTLCLAALTPGDGRVRWVAPLCQGPLGGSADWAPVGLAAAQGRAYVATGRGVVLAVDAADGAILWASRYERPQKTGEKMNPLGGYRDISPAPPGWDEDQVFVSGDMVVAAPSDSPRLVGLDPDSGALRWDVPCPAHMLRYVLGADDRHLWAAGPQQVRCYDLAAAGTQPRLVWETPVHDSAGRGIRRGAELWVPQGQTVLVLDAATGARRDELKVFDDSGDPVGNLSSDGTRLVVAGLERVRLLMLGRARLEELTQRVEHADEPARLERARVELALAQTAAAVEDLQHYLAATAAGGMAREGARRLLFNALLQQAQNDAGEAGAALAQAKTYSRGREEEARWLLAQAQVEESRGQWTAAARAWRTVALDTSGLTVALTDADESKNWNPVTGEPPAQGQVVAAQAAGQRLEELVAQHPQEVGAFLEEQGRAEIQRWTAGGKQASTAQWRALARAHPWTAAGFTATVQAARAARLAGQAEVAEVMLERLSQSTYAPRAAAGRAALAQLHEDLGWRAQAAQDWQRLAEDDGEQMVLWEGRTLPAAQVAQAALARLGSPPVVEAREEPLTGAPTQTAWMLPGGPYTLLAPEDQDAPTLFTREHLWVTAAKETPAQPPRRPGALPLPPAPPPGAAEPPGPPHLLCVRTATGQVEWNQPLPAGLRLGVMRGNGHGRQVMSQATALAPGQFILTRTDHVGVLLSARQIMGLGLTSGKTFWSLMLGGDDERTRAIAAPDPDGLDDDDIAAPSALESPRVVVGGGKVAVTALEPRQLVDELRLYDALSGEILWSRLFTKEAVNQVAIAGPYVVVTSGENLSVRVYAGATGAPLGRFAVPDLTQDEPELWLADGLVYQGYQGLTKRRWPDGQVVWTAPLVQPRPGRTMWLGHDAIGWLPGTGQEAWVIDAHSGKALARVISRPPRRGYYDLALDPTGRWLHLLGSADGGQMVLTRVDMNTGAQYVLNMVLRNAQQPAAQTAALGGPVVPVVLMQDVAAGPGQPVRQRRWGLFAVDRETGAVNALALPSPDEAPASPGADDDPGGGIRPPPWVRDGLLVVSTERGLCALRPASAGKPADAPPPGAATEPTP